MARIKFDHVYKTYEKTEIIRELNLEVEDKEFLVLVGPSGCGKSTTLRMIAGLEEVSRGDIFIGDRCVTHVPPKDRDIAMVFQNYALYPHMTVRENLEFSLKLRRTPQVEITKQVNEAAEILGIQELLNRTPKQLSGGQMQRVAMGRAIVRKPKAFLFDEPLSNLDAKLRVQMRVELAKLHKKLETTIVYVTHDQVEAMTLADRIVVMNAGRVQQIGTPLELYHRPINTFVGAFIGSPSMNQVKARIVKENGQILILGQQIRLVIPEPMASALAPHADQNIILGIRPEDIVPCQNTEDKAVLPVDVEVIEPMGGESLLYFTLENKQWVSRCEGIPSIKEGEKTNMEIHVSHLHVFSEDGSQRLA